MCNYEECMLFPSHFVHLRLDSARKMNENILLRRVGFGSSSTGSSVCNNLSSNLCPVSLGNGDHQTTTLAVSFCLRKCLKLNEKGGEDSGQWTELNKWRLKLFRKLYKL